jgi:hypothetical protein
MPVTVFTKGGNYFSKLYFISNSFKNSSLYCSKDLSPKSGWASTASSANRKQMLMAGRRFSLSCMHFNQPGIYAG